MTKDEFIDGYVKRSGIEKFRTPDGYKCGDRAQIAVPCNCGDEECRGWVMLDEETYRNWPPKAAR